MRTTEDVTVSMGHHCHLPLFKATNQDSFVSFTVWTLACVRGDSYQNLVRSNHIKWKKFGLFHKDTQSIAFTARWLHSFIVEDFSTVIVNDNVIRQFLWSIENGEKKVAADRDDRRIGPKTISCGDTSVWALWSLKNDEWSCWKRFKNMFLGKIVLLGFARFCSTSRSCSVSLEL